MEKQQKGFQQNKGPLFLLSFNLFIIMIGIGLVIPILPFYVEEYGAGPKTLGALIAVYSFMQFIFAPVWGRLSDKIGRKPLITIGLIGFAIAEFMFAFAAGVWMLFAARILAGTFGSALMPTAMAYVSDVTEAENRGKGMGILGAAMGLGIVIGPGIGGWLAEYDLSYPFIFAGIAALIAAAVSVIVLPESYSKEQREMDAKEKENEPLINRTDLLKQTLRSPVGFLLLLVFLLSFGLANFQSIFSYYSWERYGYGPRDVGLIMLIIGIIGIVVQGYGVGKMTKKFGDRRTVLISLLISAGGFVVMTLAGSFIFVLLTTGLFFIGNSLLRPSVNSLISKHAGTKQGYIMGLNNSVLSLGNVAGPILAGILFEWNIHLPYLFGAAVMLVGFVLTAIWNARQPEQASE
ncbi:DHA1 family multidrug resistance protein-like MFS transporter [Bacillus ectoiniformans]|uniref:MFS transporter n=1 Tax=Bacillus ectoiniformans TaxID=1494429 RepID=UPI00195E1FC1|nr:MFS transporter [Bacillus ectoiniformans]MBM7647619.1 DHA1 family multidrug resistance protein-like MFS transporter [Bacillus ectoiniformans]